MTDLNDKAEDFLKQLLSENVNVAFAEIRKRDSSGAEIGFTTATAN
tara:strand:+ start:356 stop:493 length:138 start_codon:yes stop_codon:yes gene_type:complete